MKDDYDLKKLKKREKKSSAEGSAKVQINIRIDGTVLANIRAEAERMGIPYQTLIGSILHRYATGELTDKKSSLGAS